MARNKSEKNPPELTECARLYKEWLGAKWNEWGDAEEDRLFQAFYNYEMKMSREHQSTWRSMTTGERRACAPK
jgi:hypothetical protein